MDGRPIRVLELLTSTSIGGGPKQVYDVVTRLPRDEFIPLIGAPRDGSYFDRFLEAGVETMELPLNRLFSSTLVRVVRLIRARRADLVHTHGKGAGLYGRLAAALAGVPALHTFHGIHYGRYAQGVDALYLGLERALSRLTRVIINVSESQAQEGAALRLFRRGQDVVIVNAVDADEVERLITDSPVTRESLGLGVEDLVLGCVTRFDRVKAVGTLLDVLERLLARFPALHLVLVGGGGDERLLRRRAASTPLAGRVTFLNFLSKPARILPAFDVYASASHREGMPLAVLEAMAAGLPVVATRVSGHIDAVEDGVTGLLAEPGDPGHFAAQVERLLVDIPLRRAMGVAARERTRRLFSIERMVAQTAAVYRRVVERGSAPARDEARPVGVVGR